jgi:hypothetical protein
MWGGTVLIHVLPNVVTRITPDNAQSSPLPDPHESGERGLDSLGERVNRQTYDQGHQARVNPSLFCFGVFFRVFRVFRGLSRFCPVNGYGQITPSHTTRKPTLWTLCQAG